MGNTTEAESSESITHTSDIAPITSHDSNPHNTSSTVDGGLAGGQPALHALRRGIVGVYDGVRRGLNAGDITEEGSGVTSSQPSAAQPAAAQPTTPLKELHALLMEHTASTSLAEPDGDDYPEETSKEASPELSQAGQASVPVDHGGGVAQRTAQISGELWRKTTGAFLQAADSISTTTTTTITEENATLAMQQARMLGSRLAKHGSGLLQQAKDLSQNMQVGPGSSSVERSHVWVEDDDESNGVDTGTVNPTFEIGCEAEDEPYLDIDLNKAITTLS